MPWTMGAWIRIRVSSQAPIDQVTSDINMETSPYLTGMDTVFFLRWKPKGMCFRKNDSHVQSTYLSNKLTSDVVSRDCKSFCTPRSRSFCCRSTAASSVLHTRFDTQYVAAICSFTLSFIMYCISLFNRLSSLITNSFADEPLAMLAITHSACVRNKKTNY